jgi:hypothetical protein
MKGAIGRLVDRPVTGAALLGELVALAAVLRIASAFVAVPRLVAYVGALAQSPMFARFPHARPGRSIAGLVRWASLAARVISPQRPCLIRSLLLMAVLPPQGPPPTLVIGVAREADALRGHAWVEYEGSVLPSADLTPPALSSFTEFVRIERGLAQPVASASFVASWYRSREPSRR